MNKTFVVALLAALLGGLTARFVATPAVHAQNPPAPASEVRAQRLTLVDSAGNAMATFSVEPTDQAPSLRVVVRDHRGREIWSTIPPKAVCRYAACAQSAE